ncbi:hypothetical protein SAMN05421504_101302 [Amycolatopsis xylanica]|uniref:NB-ARC domain-containing protein n=1 Tax=Amycolatopsis xylanica TaxID=589385 RepID=A0A1H2SRR1_9PSEU|nr:ATP-binding protein [Amycolatopsis xylanica]SDW33734.1 hypothetical protein SAMN05421504_101302 [Amycolatopsis xylanica]
MTGSARFVGRRRELLAIHKTVSTPHSALVVQGPPGIGKTTLAEHYAFDFPHSFTGVVRLGPFGHHPPEEFLSQFHLSLARAMTDRLGFDVSGITLGRLLGLCAENVLVLIDDIPADLPPSTLHRFRPPSALITTRADQADWGVPTLDLAGLTEDEGVLVFDSADAGRPAVRRLVRRCGGHPFALRAIGLNVRRRNTAADDSVLAGQPDTATEAIRALLEDVSPLARQVLRLNLALAPVPFPLELAAAALKSPVTAHAADELASLDLVSHVDGGLRVPALVRAVAGALYDPAELRERAAEALLGMPLDHDFLLQHARAVAEHTPLHRARLLRPVAAAYERLGDWHAAGETHALILSTGDAVAADLTAAARAEIGCGLYAEAAGHAQAALALADEPDRIPAALTAAQALDCQGDYAAADRIFWREHGDRLPPGEPDRLRFLVALARARRLRGRPAEAAALLEGALPEPASGDDVTQSARLEYAISLLDAGRLDRARKAAAEVVAAYRARGRDRHSQCVEAELVGAEATVSLAREQPRALEDAFAKLHGPDAPLTLTARVMADRALLPLGNPGHALRTLAVTEQAVLRVLGHGHRLHHRVVHAMAAAHGRLHEFGQQADLLETILEPRISMLGLGHPETVATRHELDIALALCGRPGRQLTSAGSQRTP